MSEADRGRRLPWQATGLAAALAAGLVVLLGGCVDQAPPLAHPGPYNTPADAIQATRVPYDPNAPGGPDEPLSRDLSQLRDARENFEHSQAVQQAELRDSQARCRDQPNSHLVHIQDGTNDPDSVYCMSGPGAASDDSGNDQ